MTNQTSTLLIDPQFGELGLGALAHLLPAASSWPAASVRTMAGLAQAQQVLDEIRAADAATQTVVALGAGCNTAAALLAADDQVRRVLLIDPLPVLSVDPGLQEAMRAANPLPAQPATTAFDGWPTEVFDDPTMAEGRWPDGAYDWLAGTMSSRPEAQQRLAAALRTVEAPRQPYQDRALAPSAEQAQHLDWFANARRAPAGAVTIWLSSDAKGGQRGALRDHLTSQLPGAKTVLQPWAAFDFMADPAPLAAAIEAWLADAQPSDS